MLIVMESSLRMTCVPLVASCWAICAIAGSSGRSATYPWNFERAGSIARRFLATLAERVGADVIAPLALAVRHDRAADHLGVERELDLLGPDREVLAQRVALPVVGHQDAPEVRV